MKYPENALALVQIAKALPPDYKVNYEGVKLISEARVDKIGKEKCYYGESGVPETSTAEKDKVLIIAIFRWLRIGHWSS